MITKQFIPGTSMSAYIKSFTIFKLYEKVTYTILPDTAPVLCFALKGVPEFTIGDNKYQLKDAFFSGLRKSFKKVIFSSGTEVILVKFQEMAASLFIEEPLHHFFGTAAPLAHLYADWNTESILDQLVCLSDDDQKIRLIETLLLNRLLDKEPDRLILAATKKIMAPGSDIKIKTLAYQSNLSLDAFEKRFRRSVGSTPKQFCSIVRMTRLINNTVIKPSLTSLAFDAGYFDQNHFIKDFKSFTGETPFNYFTMKTRPLNELIFKT